MRDGLFRWPAGVRRHLRDLQVDATNCGACGQACASHQSCVAGHRGPMCTGNETACAGACVNKMTDASNCGGCGITCLGGNLMRQGHLPRRGS